MTESSSRSATYEASRTEGSQSRRYRMSHARPVKRRFLPVAACS